jgi:hypothetical protein
MQRICVETTADHRIALLAKVQNGVVNLEQLLAAGLGLGAIEYRVRIGRLHRLYSGVFAVGHTRLTHAGRCQAALFALGARSALSDATAGDRIGLRRSSSRTIHISVPTAGGRVRREGIVVHRRSRLRPQDVEDVDGLATTSVARTLLDLAGTLAPGPLERAVERSLELRVFDLAALMTSCVPTATPAAQRRSRGSSPTSTTSRPSRARRWRR